MALLVRHRLEGKPLAVLRGAGPLRLALRVSASQVGSVIAGAALGTALAFAAVRVLGPTPELEPAAVRAAILAGAVGAVLATLVVGAVVALLALALLPRSSARLGGPVPQRDLVAA